MPPSICGRCDKMTTTVEADTSSLTSTCIGLRDQVSAWGADRRAPGHLGEVNSLKCVWARRLRQRYRVRTHREHLWSPLYFAASAGGAPPETLRAYIRQQRTFGRPG